MQEMEQKGFKVKVTEAALALPLLPKTTALNPAATCTDVDHFLHPLPAALVFLSVKNTLVSLSSTSPDSLLAD